MLVRSEAERRRNHVHFAEPKQRRGSRASKNAASGRRRRFVFVTRKEEFLALGRPGSDLLSQGLSHSTIGAEEFNGRVRDGIGFMLLARTTRPAKYKETKQAIFLLAASLVD